MMYVNSYRNHCISVVVRDKHHAILNTYRQKNKQNRKNTIYVHIVRQCAMCISVMHSHSSLQRISTAHTHANAPQTARANCFLASHRAHTSHALSNTNAIASCDDDHDNNNGDDFHDDDDADDDDAGDYRAAQ